MFLSLSSRCQFWNQVPTACGLKGGKGRFILDFEHKTGDPSPDCDGVSEDCKTKCRDKLNAMLQQVDTVWTQSVSPSVGDLDVEGYTRYDTGGCLVDLGENLALNKLTEQSSTYNNDPGFGASNAVDGNINTISHSSDPVAGEIAWWQVDLADSYEITSIVIVNRQDCCCC